MGSVRRSPHASAPKHGDGHPTLQQGQTRSGTRAVSIRGPEECGEGHQRSRPASPLRRDIDSFLRRRQHLFDWEGRCGHMWPRGQLVSVESLTIRGCRSRLRWARFDTKIRTNDKSNELIARDDLGRGISGVASSLRRCKGSAVAQQALPWRRIEGGQPIPRYSGGRPEILEGVSAIARSKLR